MLIKTTPDLAVPSLLVSRRLDILWNLGYALRSYLEQSLLLAGVQEDAREWQLAGVFAGPFVCCQDCEHQQ